MQIMARKSIEFARRICILSDGLEQLVERMTALVALGVTYLHLKSQVASKDVLHVMKSFLFK